MVNKDQSDIIESTSGYTITILILYMANSREMRCGFVNVAEHQGAHPDNTDMVNSGFSLSSSLQIEPKPATIHSYNTGGTS